MLHELCELLELDSLLEDEDELLLDTLDTLDWLLELRLDWLLLDSLLELDSSSIERTLNRSPLDGPGNCSSPVWNRRMSSGWFTSPDVLVSVREAIHTKPFGNRCWVVSTAPPRVTSTWAAGAVSSPAMRMRVITSRRLVSPTAGPSEKATRLMSHVPKRKAADTGTALFSRAILASAALS